MQWILLKLLIKQDLWQDPLPYTPAPQMPAAQSERGQIRLPPFQENSCSAWLGDAV